MAAGSGEGRMQLGKYRVVKHIATGGMGAVYKAVVTEEGEEQGREVALKVLSPEIAARPAMRERLRREWLHGAKLSHENIVEIYDCDESDGMYFLAMEYVHGKNLYEYIERHGPLAPNLARYLLLQIVAALEHVHEAGLIHRDIKPSNILLTRKNGKPVAKLADLGLIRETSDEEFRLTREGHTVGTVDYLAPEQARDSGLADIRSDIYSLGCTLFHMVTGNPPFADGNLTERLFKHAQIEAPDVRLFNAKIPADLAMVCRRMLAKKPEHRYQTPSELLAALTIPKETPLSESAEVTEFSLETPEKPKEPAGPTPAQRAAAAEFAIAQRAIAAGDLRAAIKLLINCCRLEIGQVAYREALRETLMRQRAASGGLTRGLRTAYRRARLWTAKKLRKPWQILEQGEYVLADRPKDLKAHLLLSEAALTCRAVLVALWMLEQAELTHGPHPALHRARALTYEYEGDAAQAMIAWEQVEKADPGNAEARHHLKDLSAREAMIRNRYEERLETPQL
ncbi:MAG: serine/threonine protein kinase [Gemmataceae bacterium]|nr:serine/threonine protein kinase [Gemmataceae bacterium]